MTLDFGKNNLDLKVKERHRVFFLRFLSRAHIMCVMIFCYIKNSNENVLQMEIIGNVGLLYKILKNSGRVLYNAAWKRMIKLLRGIFCARISRAHIEAA